MGWIDEFFGGVGVVEVIKKYFWEIKDVSGWVSLANLMMYFLKVIFI